MIRSNPKPSRIIIAARRLSSDIAREKPAKLPPLNLLCRRYGVSLVTMHKAVHLLEKEGLLTIAYAKGIFVKRSGPTMPYDLLEEEAGTAIARLFEKIKAEISAGTYRTGQYLPKVKRFTIAEGCSPATVCSAMHLLSARYLIHKKGQHWVVGPQPPDAPTSRPRSFSSSPTVLLFLPAQTDVDLWKILCRHNQFVPFTSQCAADLDRYGIVRVVTFDAMVPGREQYPAGRGEIISIINRLGEGYKGALILGDPADMHEWIDLFRGQRQPVAWFDLNNTDEGRDPRRAKRDKIYRLHIDEGRAVTAALDALHQSGHRRIGLTDCIGHKGASWVDNRISLIRERAAGYDPPLEIIMRSQRGEEWLWVAGDQDDVMAQHVARLRSTAGAGKSRASVGGVPFETALARSVPSLEGLFFKDKVTAIIGLSDWLGFNFHYYFRNIGVAIPHDLSIISFDNYLTHQHYPLATVDFGLGNLGYVAAHIFIGDLPIPADKRGNIAAVPFLINRGSLGAPRKGKCVVVEPRREG